MIQKEKLAPQLSPRGFLFGALKRPACLADRFALAFVCADDAGFPVSMKELVMKLQRTLVLVVLGLAACDRAIESEQSAASEPSTEPEVSLYGSALTAGARPEGDAERDSRSRPDAVLAFFGIEPGDRVLDMFSGGGYYSEILSYVVGPDGTVTAHTNQAYVGFVGEEFERRYSDGRLPNVEVLMAENNELTLEAASFDAIILILSYHDLYYADPESGWPALDVPAFLAEIHNGLTPDGVIGVVDHRAETGSPREVGGTLHRIDPAAVIEDMMAAGFRLDGESDLLSNDTDDHSLPVFNDQVRGKTDRFVLRFRKAN